MRPTIGLVTALVFIAPAAHAEPVTKRAVVIPSSPVRAEALTHRASSFLAVHKEFFVAYGGRVYLEFKVRSNGAHQVNWEARFGHNATFAVCSGTTSSATYSVNYNGCAADIEAGGIIRLSMFPNGQTGAICCARLKFTLVDVNAAAVATQD